MRVDLHNEQMGGAMLLDGAAIVGFHDALSTRVYLSRFKADPTNMITLRRVLADEISPLFVAHMTDDEVIAAIAPSLVQRCAGIVQQSALMPVFGLPDPRIADAGADPTAEPTPLGAEESPIEDDPPDPVIPPEYTRLAQVEAAALEFETLLLNAAIDRHRFSGMPPGDTSTVAPELTVIARRQGDQLEQSAEHLAAALAVLAAEGETLRKSSRIASTFTEVARQNGRALATVADSFGDQLARLGGAQTISVPQSDLASTYTDLAQAQGTQLTGAAQSFVLSLAPLIKAAKAIDTEPSEIAESLAAMARDQSDGLGDATDLLARILERLKA